MNRKNPPAFRRPAVLIEALEPRIAPAGILNESKFTSVAVGGTLLLDASGAPGTFQGLTTGTGGGSGSYLLYLVTGRALVFTTDLNGNGRLDPGEITGIALGKDSQGRDPSLILFSDVNGDIVSDLQGTTGATLTDSDHNPNNGRDGALLTPDVNLTLALRTLTAADIDPTIPGNTVANRLALTSFSIHGDVIVSGNVNSVTFDTSGESLLLQKFNGSAGDQLFTGASPEIDGIFTGTAANNLAFHFTQNNPSTPQVEGIIQPFHVPAGEHGGDIDNVAGASVTTTFSIGTLATGNGAAGERGGDLSGITMNGDTGGYQLLAGNGGDGGTTGGNGGSILNFNDLGTVTGEVILHAGDGGTGLLGNGGAGGTATFATTDIAAGVHVILGRGGDGFVNGGAGASLTAGTFTTPETVVPIGGKFYGTWHDIGDVGNTHPLPDGTYAPEAIDFNGDGFGDGVFTTTNPDAVTVVFGDGQGALLDNGGNLGAVSATVTLKVPGVSDPIVAIGDFNGDGRPDIAVASGNPNSFSGIYVFLNQIGTALDPINSRNFTHSLVGDHPFSAAMQSALPTLADQGFFQTSGAVVALATGDFNGDGITDIAYVENVVGETPTLPKAQVVGILLGDAVLNPGSTATGGILQNAQTGRLVGSGYFYADAAPPKAAAALLNTAVDGQSFTVGTDALQATSLTNANQINATTGLPANPEIVIFSQQATDHYTTISLNIPDVTTHVPTVGLTALNVGLGDVDTNRVVNMPGSIASTPAFLQALTIQDVNNDGSADVVVLTKTPANFLVDFQGDGTGTFTIASDPNGGENSGIFLGNNVIAIAITAADTNVGAHVGTFDTVGILFLPTIPAPFINEVLLQNSTGAPAFYSGIGAPTFGREFSLPTNVQDQTVLGLDTFYATAPTLPTLANPVGANLHPATGYGVLSPESTIYTQADLFLFAAAGSDPTLVPTLFPSEIRYLTNNGYAIQSGDGGNATTGVGGAAGVVGGMATGIGSGTGAVTIVFPASATYQGDAFLQGGNGGNGFAGGGIGGDVTGIAVRYAAAATTLTSSAQLAAGNGGNGISGDGGRGGNLSMESIETGSVFSAGDAGSGLHGGQGGSITGNQSGVYDTSTVSVRLTTGKGGEGALAGGSGGNISNWDSQFLNIVDPGGSTLSGLIALSYVTGAGGGAAGGNGGNGGSILNSSPDQNQNDLTGTLTLETGTGGGGLTGGNGGAITTFVNNTTNQSALATALTVLTGAGGVGVNSVGGTGGNITGFSSNATGLTSGTLQALTGIGRIIAGDGGASYGAAGGLGGSITSVTATTTSTPLVVAAGAGGDGLTAGGNGGAVTNSTVDSAALQIGKLLVVAGKGGDAYAALPADISLPGDADTTDLAHAVLAFGNASGLGGNGGNISNVTQPISAQTAVDLIAGNGGSTPNASTALTATTGVGRGGSITDVVLTGTAGAISRDETLGAVTNPAIQSYAMTDDAGTTTTLPITSIIDQLGSQTSQFSSLNDNASALATLTISGNVGVVAGSAGTVRAGQPASDGVNGDVTNLSAASIMSIVAGSVDSVAPVRILSGITVTNSDGVLGADKSPNAPFGPNGVLDYLDLNGVDVTNLEAGYRLIDGAIFASTIEQTAGTPIVGPRVFSPAT